MAIKQIKKYKNRRLYDTTTSRYITTDDLLGDVIAGTAFVVEDVITGRDITNSVLLQIVVDMEANTTSFLSTEMLRQLIVLAHHPLSQSLKTTVAKTMSSLADELERTTQASSVASVSDLWQQQSQVLVKQWLNLFTGVVHE